jgi:hypothetical protein
MEGGEGCVLDCDMRVGGGHKAGFEAFRHSRERGTVLERIPSWIRAGCWTGASFRGTQAVAWAPRNVANGLVESASRTSLRSDRDLGCTATVYSIYPTWVPYSIQ